ncbi:MAG: SRPBCC family protein [Chloroflexi bacterium]|nr:SRPBCC family protein [Chloroflexota bacterium]
MPSLQESVTVNAPADKVWEAVVDFEGRPKYSSRVKEAKLLDGAPLREGSRIRLVVDRNAFTPVVQGIQPKERLTLLVKGPGFNATHEYRLAAQGGAVQVTIAARYGGLMGGVFGGLMKGSFQRDLVDELAAIKKAAEGV